MGPRPLASGTSARRQACRAHPTRTCARRAPAPAMPRGTASRASPACVRAARPDRPPGPARDSSIAVVCARNCACSASPRRRVSTTYELMLLKSSMPQSAKKTMMSSAGTSPTKMNDRISFRRTRHSSRRRASAISRAAKMVMPARSASVPTVPIASVSGVRPTTSCASHASRRIAAPTTSGAAGQGAQQQVADRVASGEPVGAEPPRVVCEHVLQRADCPRMISKGKLNDPVTYGRHNRWYTS